MIGDILYNGQGSVTMTQLTLREKEYIRKFGKNLEIDWDDDEHDNYTQWTDEDLDLLCADCGKRFGNHLGYMCLDEE